MQMDTTRRKQLTEELLARIPTDRAKHGPLGRDELQTFLTDELPLDAPETATLLKDLESAGIVRLQAEPGKFLEIRDPNTVGAARLIRNFCARYYGEVSPLVEKKMLQAVIKRHGARHDLDAPGVQATLKDLESAGLIRLMGSDHSYIKMLGLP